MLKWRGVWEGFGVLHIESLHCSLVSEESYPLELELHPAEFQLWGKPLYQQFFLLYPYLIIYYCLNSFNALLLSIQYGLTLIKVKSFQYSSVQKNWHHVQKKMAHVQKKWHHVQKNDPCAKKWPMKIFSKNNIQL